MLSDKQKKAIISSYVFRRTDVVRNIRTILAEPRHDSYFRGLLGIMPSEFAVR